MILSDREIQIALQRKTFSITEEPPVEAYASTAVDMCLDALLQIWQPLRKEPGMGIDPCFCPMAPDFNVSDLIKKHTVTHNLKERPFRILPRSHWGNDSGESDDSKTDRQRPLPGFILGWTKEKLRIPHDCRLCARVEGKSSLARIGLGVHVTAPTIHAGFGVGKDPKGDALQLEIWNVGPLPIELEYGMRICQLIFEEVHGVPAKGYQGQFLGQGPKPPTASKLKGKRK